MCITLFCTFLCLQCTTTTWNDQILSLLGNGNGKAINSTISVRTWARSSLFSSSQNPLLLSNRASLKWCEVCFSATFPWTSPLSDRKVPNDDGYHIFPPKWRWFAHAHYLVLGKFRSRSRPCLRIECSLVSLPGTKSDSSTDSNNISIRAMSRSCCHKRNLPVIVQNLDVILDTKFSSLGQIFLRL